MNNKLLKQYLFLALFIIMTGFGAALVMHVAIGVSPWDAMTQSISEVFNMQIGTMGLIINLFLILLQVFILRQFRVSMLIQIPMSLILGLVVNFVYYTFLKNFILDHYILQVVFFFVGQVIIASSIGGIMVINKAFFPLEGTCLAISEKTKIPFIKIRQMFDVVCVIIALIIFFGFKTTLTVREGSIIGMFIFSPMVGMFMKLYRPHLS